jgi:hypothetical protein
MSNSQCGSRFKKASCRSFLAAHYLFGLAQIDIKIRLSEILFEIGEKGPAGFCGGRFALKAVRISMTGEIAI